MMMDMRDFPSYITLVGDLNASIGIFLVVVISVIKIYPLQGSIPFVRPIFLQISND